MQYTAPTVTPGPSTGFSSTTVVLYGHGDFDKVAVEDTPAPTKLEDDHIELAAFYHGLNFTDNYLRLGIIRNKDFPVVMGSECTGIIARIGANVHDLLEGDRVLCLRMHAGLFQRSLHIPRKYCYRLDDHISLRNGLALGLNFVVAHTCLFELGRLKPGQVVFMTSVGGGVGTSVVQLARTVPNVTVMGTASESKHESLLSLGINHVFRFGQSFMMKILFPRGADIVINSKGGSDIEECLYLLKPFGRLINIGSNNSVKSAINIPLPLQKPKWDGKNIRSASIVGRNYLMSGLDIGYHLENNRPKVQAILSHVFDLVGSQEIKPIIHTILPMERAAEGLKLLCKRENFGKVILHKI
ncbi:synaptic vesicle membrane protein VAT-1 homolog [Schistocerca cancellata]|uniref:synaptic vesicle membrane protein VAT-1 homolog n=1 Tax=Schistocerca cancellata TaxID=274614 RepID=UPI002118133B|nr:synaptic vesicle membrane protein VAT-1 homolog [Schistocerca cancellata]